jgi:hypothetical protein
MLNICEKLFDIISFLLFDKVGLSGNTGRVISVMLFMYFRPMTIQTCAAIFDADLASRPEAPNQIVNNALVNFPPCSHSGIEEFVDGMEPPTS